MMQFDGTADNEKEQHWWAFHRDCLMEDLTELAGIPGWPCIPPVSLSFYNPPALGQEGSYRRGLSADTASLATVS